MIFQITQHPTVDGARGDDGTAVQREGRYLQVCAEWEIYKNKKKQKKINK